MHSVVPKRITRWQVPLTPLVFTICYQLAGETDLYIVNDKSNLAVRPYLGVSIMTLHSPSLVIRTNEIKFNHELRIYNHIEDLNDCDTS